MTLVDTTAWIDFFGNRGRLAARVDEPLAENGVALYGPILTELGRGLSSARRTHVLELLRGCHHLAQPRICGVRSATSARCSGGAARR